MSSSQTKTAPAHDRSGSKISHAPREENAPENYHPGLVGTSPAEAFVGPTKTSHRHLEQLEHEMEKRARLRDVPERRGGGFLPTRVRDLTKVFGLKFGDALPDDDYGRDLIFIHVHHVVRLNGDAVRNMRRHAGRWAPWMEEDELEALIRRVFAKPIRWKGTTLGRYLGLLDAERSDLKIMTIAPIDVSRDERERRWREKANTKRRKETREEYLAANSISRTKPWLAESISRRTWYRRKADAARVTGGHRCPVAQVREHILSTVVTRIPVPTSAEADSDGSLPVSIGAEAGRAAARGLQEEVGRGHSQSRRETWEARQ
jgi:hypothetical protein